MKKISTLIVMISCARLWAAPPVPKSEPEKLGLIWNVGTAPFRAYKTCRTPNVDFCVPTGKWWGVCKEDKDGKTIRTLTPGQIKIETDGDVTFSGCETYELL